MSDSRSSHSILILFFSLLISLLNIIAVLVIQLGAFDDDEIIHVDNSIDPVRDLETIHEELLLKDIEFVERRVEILKHAVEKGIDKTKKADLVCFLISFHHSRSISAPCNRFAFLCTHIW